MQASDALDRRVRSSEAPVSALRRAAAYHLSPTVGLAEGEYIELLKAQYRNIIYMRVSHYIGNAVFEQFLFLTADRIMKIVSSFAGFCSVRLEPFVHKLLSTTALSECETPKLDKI